MSFKKISFRKIEKKETPSGMWDNGLYVITDQFVEFPLPLFESSSIVEGEKIKTDESGKAFGAVSSPRMFGNFGMFAMRITIDGRSWLVVPGGKIETQKSLEES